MNLTSQSNPLDVFLQDVIRKTIAECGVGAQPAPEVLDVKEAAAFLKIGETKLRELMKGRSFPVHKAGNQYRFLKHELADWLTKQR